MVANPLNSAFCVGPGLGIDTLGRPTWKRELAGIWQSPNVGLFNQSGTGNIVMSNLVARIQNTTNVTRELMFTARSGSMLCVDWSNCDPMVEILYGLGPTVTQGVVSLGVARMDMYVSHGILMIWPGPSTGVSFVTLAPGAAFNIAITAVCRAVFTGGLFNASIDGTQIEAHWLGA